MNEAKKRRGAIRIMGQLIILVKPMLPIMTAAILLGTVGYLCAIFLTISATKAVFAITEGRQIQTGFFVLLLLLAVLRGVFHYAEQYCNHFIAFKLLAEIRHKVFAALRELCPAKLEGHDKGNLISVITTDIELLEVFYAHTISPIAIAILTSLCMLVFLWQYHWLAGMFALAAYLCVGLVLPMWNGRKSADKGMEYRSAFGDLSSFVLESMRGLDETIQYGYGEKRKQQMEERSTALGEMKKSLSQMEGKTRALTNLVILLCSFGILFLMLELYGRGIVGKEAVLMSTVAMMGSFGPVVALSNLSNNLNQTLASGERVLSILEETPMVQEVPDTKTGESRFDHERFGGAKASHVFFAYENEVILKDYSIELKPGCIIGIHGASGSGKSTLLKLLMRFWDADQGTIEVDGKDIRTIPTRHLRNMESYVTQETHLFHDSLANNIAIGKPGASREEIIEAAKMASLHEFIESLPDGYDTKAGELGDTLSGGEKQRIGLARAFLHDAPFLLLDEPTSNLDSLNEGIILKSICNSCKKKTVVLVSHRKSTMTVADEVYEMNNGRVS